jgi:hypothetical protein
MPIGLNDWNHWNLWNDPILTVACCLTPHAYSVERFERLELLEPLERLKQQSVTKPQTHRPGVHTN